VARFGHHALYFHNTSEGLPESVSPLYRFCTGLDQSPLRHWRSLRDCPATLTIVKAIAFCEADKTSKAAQRSLPLGPIIGPNCGVY
jgi:hypothetical protein